MDILTSISPERKGFRSRPLLPSAPSVLAGMIILAFLAGCSTHSGMHGRDDLYGVGTSSSDSGFDDGGDGRGEDAYGAAGSRGSTTDSSLRGSRSEADVYGSSGSRSSRSSTGPGRSSAGQSDLYSRRRGARPLESGRTGSRRGEDIYRSTEGTGQEEASKHGLKTAQGRDAYNAVERGEGETREKAGADLERKTGEGDTYGISGTGERKSKGSSESAPPLKGPAKAPEKPVVAKEEAPTPPSRPAMESSLPAAEEQTPTVIQAQQEQKTTASKPKDVKPAAPLPEHKLPQPPAEKTPPPQSEPAPKTEVPAPAPAPEKAEAVSEAPKAVQPENNKKKSPARVIEKEKIIVEQPVPAETAQKRPGAPAGKETMEKGTADREQPDRKGARAGSGRTAPDVDVPEALYGTAEIGRGAAAGSAVMAAKEAGAARDLYRVSEGKPSAPSDRPMVAGSEDLYGKEAAGNGRARKGREDLDRAAKKEADLYGHAQGEAKRPGANGGTTTEAPSQPDLYGAGQAAPPGKPGGQFPATEGATDDYDVSGRLRLPSEGIVVINRPPNLHGLTGLLITNSAYTLEKGKRAVGVSFMAEDSRNPDFTVLQLPVTMTFGIKKDMELGVKLKLVDIDSATPPQNERGFGDAEVLFKWHFAKEGLIIPDLAVGVSGILPMASEQRGLNEVVDYGLKIMAMASQEKRITETVIMGAYVEAQAVFIDEIVRSGSTPGAERYGIINVGVLFPVAANNRLQAIAEHNQIVYKSSYQPTLLEGNQSMSTAAVRYVTESFNITAGAQYINKEKNSDDNTIRLIGTVSYTF